MSRRTLMAQRKEIKNVNMKKKKVVWDKLEGKREYEITDNDKKKK